MQAYIDHYLFVDPIARLAFERGCTGFPELPKLVLYGQKIADTEYYNDYELKIGAGSQSFFKSILSLGGATSVIDFVSQREICGRFHGC